MRRKHFESALWTVRIDGLVEREIVLALAEGLSNRKVSVRLNISEGTVGGDIAR